MSLEQALAESRQSVLILTKSVDLLAAVIGDLIAVMQSKSDTPIVSATVLKQATDAAEKIVEGTKTVVADPELELKAKAEQLAAANAARDGASTDLTDDQVKGSPEYQKVIGLMGSLSTALQANGATQDAAKTEVLKLLGQFADTGKALPMVAGWLKMGDKASAAKLETAFNEAIAEQKLITEQAGPGDDDFGDETAVEAKKLTAEDVKVALRDYAAVEGKPAAIAAMDAAGGSKSVAGLKEADYAAVIKALAVAKK